MFMFQSTYRNSDRAGFDMSKLMLLGFVLIVIVLIHFIGEKKEDDKSPQQGSLIVELYWNDALETDLDLWVKAPDDVPVGYSNMGGRYFNLLRDDLGSDGRHDISGKNMEIAVSRGLPEGEYIVNVHLFMLDGASFPVHFKVLVSLKRNPQYGTEQLFSIDSKMVTPGQEKTLIQFSIDEDGELIEDSIHHTQERIRAIQDLSP